MPLAWVEPGRRLQHRQSDGVTATVVFTDRTDGDMAPGGEGSEPDPEVRARWARLHPAPLGWARQVHGAGVMRLEVPGAGAGTSADALVTAALDAPVAVFAADCAPVMLVSNEGPVGAVHAGWRGLVAGVVDAAVTALVSDGAENLWAVIGPCIGSECYEFGAADLEHLVAVYGDEVAGTTGWGTPALDLRAAVGVAVERAGAGLIEWNGPESCTSCSAEYRWSYRARMEAQRQAAMVWRQR